MNFQQNGIQLGPLVLSYYGMVLIAALLAGGGIAFWRARRRGENPEIVVDVLAWSLILGLAVGRLFYIMDPPPSVATFYDRHWYLTHPFDLQAGPLAIWNGGLGTAGALVGGMVGTLLVLLRRRVALWRWADILAPGVLLFLAISPWGNMINRELYGPPTDLPWGLPVEFPVPPYSNTLDELRFHPTPAYLALWALLTLVVIYLVEWRWSDRLRSGSLFLLATLIYVPGLFLADLLRVDVSRTLFGLSGVQLLAALILAGIVALGVWRWAKLRHSPLPSQDS